MSKKYNPVKKENWRLNAQIKTLADYALVLEYINGYSRGEAIEAAQKSHGEPLFEKLMQRNEDLFKTGTVQMFD